MTLKSKLAKLSNPELPPEDPLAAIARNLDAVLNARRGYSGALEIFGLGDHDAFVAKQGNTKASGDESPPKPAASTVAALAGDMLEQVLRFEPRLVGPTVRYVGRYESMWARFEITGSVQGTKQVFPVRFHVVLRNVQVLAPVAAP
jgi:predicted component of type VI protein secretion system